MGRLISNMQLEASALLLAAWQSTVAALWQSLRSVSRRPHSNLEMVFYFIYLFIYFFWGGGGGGILASQRRGLCWQILASQLRGEGKTTVEPPSPPPDLLGLFFVKKKKKHN